MIIKNISQKTIISENAIHAKSLKRELFGLIFFKKPAVMLFRSRFGIHTFFMSYPIDVIILNENKIVKAIKKNLKPNRLFFWNIKYPYVIELPPDTIKKTKTSIEDLFELIW